MQLKTKLLLAGCYVFVRRVKKVKKKVPLIVLIYLLQKRAEKEAVVRGRDPTKRKWWARSLKKRAPKLSGGDGTRWRTKKFFGEKSDYATTGPTTMSAAEYYFHFRFARDHIPRLVKALEMPEEVRTRTGCCMSGEEALLMFLKRMSYPERTVGLMHFFGCCSGYISDMVDAVREHLHKKAVKMTRRFDASRIKPLARAFSNQMWAKGMPLRRVLFIVDGVFVGCCRPFDAVEGYKGTTQRSIYSGAKRKHGLM
jgi:hypothetical protein